MLQPKLVREGTTKPAAEEVQPEERAEGTRVEPSPDSFSNDTGTHKEVTAELPNNKDVSEAPCEHVMPAGSTSPSCNHGAAAENHPSTFEATVEQGVEEGSNFVVFYRGNFFMNLLLCHWASFGCPRNSTKHL